jgi:DNA-binding MarR family transcriptional regulator
MIIDVSQKGTRDRQLELTESGIEKLNKAELLWTDAQNYIIEKIGEENVEKLTVLLSMIESI